MSGGREGRERGGWRSVCTLILQDGDKVEVVAEDGDEVVVGGGDDGREICGTRGLGLGLKEVVTH